MYLHIPFCLAKCPYCDFYSAPADALGIAPRQYFDLVARELDLLCRDEPGLERRDLVTLYVGGGTPSLVEPALYRRFFDRLRATFRVDPALEWTLEVNPGTVDGGRLDQYLALGVNRLSLGVQSFSDATLERLGRAHRSAEVRALLDRLGAASRPSPTWGIDLIFGAPGQTLAQWQADVETALDYRPHHVSVYGLTIHAGTPFDALARAGRLDLPDEETQRAMFRLARRRLTRAGYEHYEISNYALLGPRAHLAKATEERLKPKRKAWLKPAVRPGATGNTPAEAGCKEGPAEAGHAEPRVGVAKHAPGHRSRHNERYWTGADYLGLGVAAHSMVGGRRWSNPPDVARYGEAIRAGRLPRRIETPPTGRARFGEYMMLGLRRLEGVEPAHFRERFDVDPAEIYAPEIERLRDAGLIEIVGGRLRLSQEGLLVADAVMAEFF